PQPSYVPATAQFLSGNLLSLGSYEGLKLSWEVPQDTADVRYFFESSSDLRTWVRSYSYLEMGPAANGRRQVSFTGSSSNPFGASHRFFRLAVEQSAPSLAPSF
ncbi:MAG: hypothetical protein ACOYOF_16705, partial [Verrucomicrobiaceae bacterium]